MCAHEVCQGKTAFRSADEQRTSFFKMCDGLTRIVIVGKQIATIRITLKCFLIESSKQLVLIDFQTKGSRKFPKETDPGINIGCAIITMYHGHGYRELTELATQVGKRFLFESAVMDGAPIFSLFRQPLAGAKLLGFTGILNSCTNLLLERMEAGETLNEAIAYGTSIGITETDPSNDVDGWDASIKIAALATVLMNHPMTPLEVDRTGIRGITPEMIAAAKAAGERWKLICTGEFRDGVFIAEVKPRRVGPDSPFYTVSGTSSFVTFRLDVLPGLGVLESDPGPETTAFGLLSDLIYACGD